MQFSAPIFRLKRQAKQLARESGMPRHQALDHVARREGFRSWSHLASSAPYRTPAQAVLAQCAPGDLVLLGARPGQGKTLLGLALAVEAARSGRPGYFFTLADAESEVFQRLEALGIQRGGPGTPTLDTSDEICADHIVRRLDLSSRVPGPVVVVDYLQVLDQKRRHPDLSEQVARLKAFASASGGVVVAISQIDRAFDPSVKPLPDLSDVRLPNPLDLSMFTKACFLHAGEIALRAVA